MRSRSYTLASALPFLFLLLLSPGLVQAQSDRINGKQFATRSPVIARHGMVATSQPLAAQIGLQILKEGGSAVDAAIAVDAALGLMEPTGSGMGGDLFAIVYDAKTQQLYGLNASGRAPLGLSYDEMKAKLKELGRDDIPPYGMMPISVPGAVDGWFELHKKFGKLPMSKILAPTIKYAEEGFPVTQLISYYWRRSAPFLSKQPGAFRETFTIDGRGPKPGEIFKNPDLAHTLRILSKKGRDAFYEGEIADKIDKFMRENGGYLRKKDFENHTSTWVDPVSVNYRGYDVYELPPNGQGIAALQILQILKGFDLKSMGYGSADALHVMLEAKKLAFEDRAKFYADPAFSDVPVQELISEAYAAKRRKLIDMNRAARRVTAGNPKLEEGDTVYMTAADDEGNMVSLIQSNYRGMGSGVVVPGLGFGFQDRGELFSMDPEHANVYAPGKRPFHTIIPSFVMKDGKPFMSFGVMGGAMQPQGHVQILTDIIDFGMNVQEAGDAARWRHLGSSQPTDGSKKYLEDGGYVELESGVPYSIVHELMMRGHDVRYGMGGYGGYQAIRYDAENGVYIGASESRKDGQAVGY